MQISLVQISLLRFFKTFQKYFLYLANAILGLKILPNAILFAIYFVTAIIKVKICLMRFLANATFSRSQKLHKTRTLCTNFFFVGVN